MLGLFKRTPKLEVAFTPTIAVARELAKEVEVAGDLVNRNVGKDAELTDLEVVLVAGGTRRIDLELPLTWRGPQRIPAGGELRAAVVVDGGSRRPDAGARRRDPAEHHRRRQARAARLSNKFPLANE